MSERLWGVGLVTVGLLWIWDGWKLQEAERMRSMFDALGPDRYLILMGSLLVLTGAIIALSKPEPVLIDGSAEPEPELSWGQRLTSAPVIFTVALAAYAFLIPILGYTGSTFLFFLAGYYIAGRRNLVWTLVTSVISAGAFYVIFPYLADMTLPRGILGF